MNRETAVKTARTIVELEAGDGEGCPWLVGAAPHCYGNPTYYTETHVLQGSPARGYILDMGRHGGGTVIAFGSRGRRLKTTEYTQTIKGAV